MKNKIEIILEYGGWQKEIKVNKDTIRFGFYEVFFENPSDLPTMFYPPGTVVRFFYTRRSSNGTPIFTCNDERRKL